MTKTELVLIEYKKGLTVPEISEITGLTIRTVTWAINKSGFRANKRSKGKLLDDKFYEFILGSMLGDGSIQKDNRLSIAHCPKQKDYINYKWEIVNSYDLAGNLGHYTIYNNRYKNGYFEEYRFKTLCTDKMKNLRSLFYLNGKKQLPSKEYLLKYLTPFSIAIWYMDDGYKLLANVGFSTQSFSETECNILRDIFLSVYNVETTLQPSGNNIIVRAKSLTTFFNLIENHVIDSMKYKLRTYRMS